MKAQIEKASYWWDLASMVLLALAIVMGGLTPSRPVWGHSRKRTLAIVSSFAAATIFSAFRFVLEGIYETPGPREFLAGTVVYIGRWLWLFFRMSRLNSTEARLFEVARALRELRTLRIGPSTDTTANRKGEWEVVRRRGVRNIPADILRKNSPVGDPYWRGVKKSQEYVEIDECWDVELVQKGLHSNFLDAVGTIEYLTMDQAAMDEAYRRFYNVVLTAVAVRQPTARELGVTPSSQTPGASTQPPAANPPAGTPAAGSPAGPAAQKATAQGPSSNRNVTSTLPRVYPDREVDFSPFFANWWGLSVEALAQSVNATDVRPIGRVARKVAADAVYYVNDKNAEFRTKAQVKVINQCLDAAADRHLPSLSKNSGSVAIPTGNQGSPTGP